MITSERPRNTPSLVSAASSAPQVMFHQQSLRDCPLRDLRGTSSFPLGLAPQTPACSASACSAGKFLEPSSRALH